MNIPKIYDYQQMGNLFVECLTSVEMYAKEVYTYVCAAFGIPFDYDGLKEEDGIVIDGFEVEDILEELIEKAFNVSLEAGDRLASRYCEKHVINDALDHLDICFRGAIWMWNYIADGVNNFHIEVKNMENGVAIGDKMYLGMGKDSILFILFSGLDTNSRKFTIPILMGILKELHEVYVEKEPTEENKMPEADPNMPKEIHDSIFKNSGLSELLSLFEKIGTFRPAKDYDNPADLETHERIEVLMDKVFSYEPDFEDEN